jgi:Ni,Fe-hydrogenase III large subunit
VTPRLAPAPAGAVLRSIPTTRDRVAGQVAAFLDAGYRCLVVCGQNRADVPGEGGAVGGPGVRMAYTFARPRSAPGGEDRVELTVDVPVDDAWVPSVAELSYPAGRFEREVRDLFGVEPRDHPLPRRLARHAHWPRGWHPLLGERPDPDGVPPFETDVSAFPFLEVQGDGVYEIPVGPVHAGLIEPGHFRFSVVGETVIRLKARLWYLHRGVERLFEGRVPQDGIELAERISGDTSAGHAVAYALACEQALGLDLPEPDLLLRGLLLELERLYNHVNDIGAILNDVAFGLAHAHAQRIREHLLRLNATVTGHRLLRGAVRVGGTAVTGLPDVAAVRALAAELAEVVELSLAHPMVLDRLVETAVLRHEDAVRIGVLGYVARASGVDLDARRDHPFLDPALLAGPGDAGETFPVLERSGDVLARLRVRAREAQVSARLVGTLVERLDGRTGTPCGATPSASAGSAAVGSEPAGAESLGLGIVEAWRGLLCHRVALDTGGRLARVKVVDPSFMTWPGLPVAMADTIVPDFPLANKSFNQSYAGNDL